MKATILIFLIGVSIYSQQYPIDESIKFHPFVKVKDTIEDAFEIYCIGDHPNCWAGTGKRHVGYNRAVLYKTYIQINDSLVLIDTKKIYKEPVLGGIVISN